MAVDRRVIEALEAYAQFVWTRHVSQGVADAVSGTVWEVFGQPKPKADIPIPNGPKHQRPVKSCLEDASPSDKCGLTEVGREGLTRRLNAGLVWMDHDWRGRKG